MSNLTFAPILPISILFILVLAVLALSVVSWMRGNRGTWMRLAAAFVLLAGLLNPQIVTKDTQALSDIGLILVDKSSSQNTEQRLEQINKAVNYLQKESGLYHDLEIRTVEITPDGQEDKKGTQAVKALRHAVTGINKDRFAGSVLITDGQIHDLDNIEDLPAPLHVLLTGSKNERDRRIKILNAPRYGLIGEELEIRVQILDNGQPNTTAPLYLITPEGKRQVIPADNSDIRTIKYTPEHAGQSVIVLEASPLENEISLSNNKAALNINGVRERLRVLLVSGLPHQGQRTWRNILRSDPSVDLVHFTILRPSEKEDFTPLNELSLIAFPVRELFEEKLSDFDLIIFDRYYKHNVLSEGYFENINEYVREGGAILVSAGPDFTGPRSLAKTRLNQLLPVEPSGQIFDDQPFSLTRSNLGKRHPITNSLGKPEKEWGRWMRLIDLQTNNAQTLLETDNKKPVLLVERVEKGRLAILLSDHIWLWARGFDGGGPHGELTRNLVHWLMKEPDLEEERLSMHLLDDGQLEITRQSLTPPRTQLELTSPDGTLQNFDFTKGKNGQYHARVPAHTPGIYRATDGLQKSVIGVGSLNPKEFLDPRSSDEHIQKLTKSIHWISEGLPVLKRTGSQSTQHGPNWLGFKQNHAEAVTGIKNTTLLPMWAVFLIILGLWSLAWWREGH